jgi:hypothetical protein
MTRQIVNRQSRLCCLALLAFTLVPPAIVGAEGHLKLSKTREERFSAPLLSLDVSSAGNLAAALGTGEVRIWRLDTGQLLHQFTFPEPETDPRLKNEGEVEPIRVRFSPDGQTLGVSHLSRIYLYDTKAWQPAGSLGVEGEDTMRPRPVPTLARRPEHEEPRPEFTYDQMAQDWIKLRAMGDGRTRVTDFVFAAGGSRILAAYCRGSSFDGPHRLIDTASGNDPVRLWDVPGGRLLWERTYGSDIVVERIVPSPNGQQFVVAAVRPGWTTVELDSLQTGGRVYSLPPVNYPLGDKTNIMFTPDALRLITFWAGPFDKKFVPWRHLAAYDAATGQRLITFGGRVSAHGVGDISPDGRWVVVPTENLITLQVLDAANGEWVRAVKQFPWGWSGPLVGSVRFDPSGRYLIAANMGAGRLAVYRVRP